MNLFLEAHHTVLQHLLDKEVNFMLIGGYAVNYYGYSRVTADLDVWLQPANDNKLLLLDALAGLGFNEQDLAVISNWDFTAPQKFHVFEKPFQTEFMTHISGVTYDEAISIAVKADIDGLALNIIHYNTLIQNKKATLRTKDLADVEYLEKIVKLRKKKN